MEITDMSMITSCLPDRVGQCLVVHFHPFGHASLCRCFNPLPGLETDKKTCCSNVDFLCWVSGNGHCDGATI
jgi:hypothetical protein